MFPSDLAGSKIPSLSQPSRSEEGQFLGGGDPSLKVYIITDIGYTLFIGLLWQPSPTRET